MMEVCVFLADGFEEIEGLTVVDLLRRAGIGVETVSVMERKTVHGGHGILVEADRRFHKADFKDTKMLVLPGGLKGTENLKAHQGVANLVMDFAMAGKYVAAICAAPTSLAAMGLLDGKKAVCYPTMSEELTGAEFVDKPAVADGNVITGRGMGSAIEFSLLLIEALRGREKADEIAEQVVFHHAWQG